MGLKQDIEKLVQRSENEYNEYKTHLATVTKEYEDKCGEFAVLIGTINAERLRFRNEIRELYDFLQAIGGSLKSDNRISVFEFSDEGLAPNQLYKEIPKLDEPDFKKSDIWDFLWKGGLFLTINHLRNRKLYTDFFQEVENRKNEYDKDISERTTQIMYLKDAIEIAKIYRNTIVIVRDTVNEKIIPELELIQAFLYADAIRERILEGGKLENIEPINITEYKSTNQDVHYQFVQNAFDFYKISTTFFRRAVLTNILQDRIVTKEEVREFEKQVEDIKKEIEVLESKRMI